MKIQHLNVASFDLIGGPLLHNKGLFDWNNQWVTHALQIEQWFGFDCIRPIKDMPDDILLIPMEGHITGHSAVAVAVQAILLSAELDSEFVLFAPAAAN